MKYGICFLALCGLSLLLGCDKEDKSMGSGTSTGNPAVSHMQQTKVKPQVLHVHTADADTVVSQGGLLIAVPAGAFSNQSGTVIDGDTIDLLVTECWKNGQYIASAIGTAATDKEILTSRVAFKMEARLGNQSLNLVTPLTVLVPSTDIVADDDLHISEPVANSDKADANTALWVQGVKPKAIYDTPSATYRYGITVERNSWYQLAKLRDLSNGTVDLEVQMPFGALVRTCIAVLIMPDLGTMYLQPNEQANRFNTYHFKVPKGITARVLLIRKLDKQLSYSLQSFTIDKSKLLGVDQISNLTQEQLDDLLKTL